ncbi:hypothetical protein LTR36_003925 [Oleoguttula mirabilis]|uniref:Beige protein homolog 1 n=1 Tax=Oleoguttula mirabilis TaxID=1507867 RepID=A0AAV9JHF8_9PEZI|nr:hypothetical protein LTR36_003925 [Oleoguttula mirabilis]
MALHVVQIGRQRSATNPSRGLNADEQSSETADLIREFAFDTHAAFNNQISHLSDVARRLKQVMQNEGSSRDTFRHGAGFESILDVFSKLHGIGFAGEAQRQRASVLVEECLQLLGESLHNHRGNQRYFSGHAGGWESLGRSLANLQDAVDAVSGEQQVQKGIEDLYEGLITLALAGEASYATLRREVDAHAPTGGTVDQPLLADAVLQHPKAAFVAVQLASRLVTSCTAAGSDDSCSAAVSVYRAVAAVAASSTRNAVALWQAGVVSETLMVEMDDSAPPEVKAAAHELTLSLATFGLGNLDDVARLFMRARESNAARGMLLELLKTSKGPAFVQFDLTQCGYSSIELPSLPRAFPPTTGYTLTAWIRIDEFDPNCHTTIFGAFDTSQACFVLVYLEKDSHQLILQTSVRSSRPSVRFKSTRFKAKQWYHVALVHRKAASDARQSPAVLFVDGEFAEQVKCGYPDTPPELDEKRATGSPRARAVQAFFGTPHDLAFRTGRNEVRSKWSLANTHLHAAPLTDEFLAVHYRVGPRYSGNFQDCLGPLLTYRASAELNRYNELLHPDKSDKSDIVTATEGHGSDVMPESRLLLSFSPLSIMTLDGSQDGLRSASHELDRKALPRYQQLAQKTRAIMLNAAVPTINEAISRSYGTGILTGDPVVALPKALDDASWCLAGTLPLLIRLLESAHSKAAFLQASQIYFDCVKDNWRISEAMEKGNGFGLYALILREKLGFDSVPSYSALSRKPAAMLSLEDRQTLPMELLQLVLDFVGYNSNKPEDSMIVNPMAYRVLLIDFDTWRRCDAGTQELYYTQFVHLVSHNRHQAFNQKRLTRMRVIKKLIEALKSEEISADAIGPFTKAVRALLDNHSAHTMYRDLAMFVAFGLQDDRAVAARPMRTMASIVNLRQRTASWARNIRSSRPSTPGGAHSQRPQLGLPRFELAVHVLDLLTEVVCDESNGMAIRRFNKAVPNRWLLHLLAESDVRVMEKTMRIISHALAVLGSEFKAPFVDKNGGFVTLRSRLKLFWRSPSAWIACFAILFGQAMPQPAEGRTLTLFTLVQAFGVDDGLIVVNQEVLSTLMAMLETGLRAIVKEDDPPAADASVLKAVIQFLSELYTRSAAFREFAGGSRYVQELLFVLYPVLVGSDRLSAETELQAEKGSLSFKGEEVKMRPHSNSLGERPPSIRSLDMDKRTPSPMAQKRVAGPRRLSSFVMVHETASRLTRAPAQFNPTLAPKTAEPVKINIGNGIVESLLEVVVNLFIDLVCTKKEFQGIGLFLKVPPGFREHQAYFESYVLVNTLSQLWNFLKLNQGLLLESKVLTNLARYSMHLAEAVFEGWFVDGAQPVLDFTGQVLEYLQQPDIAETKSVRLCSHVVSNIRVVFLRVTLWRLSELDETVDEAEAVAFLDKMNYWQTILFSSENQETLFSRLICFLLYLKLVSDVQSVRLAAARMWRTVLVQKPTETATLLSYAMGSEQRHLSTGFMMLVSMDDEEFITWVDRNRSALDPAFISTLNKPWDDFVGDENKRNEETAKMRLNKRRDKLRKWQAEEASTDDYLRRYEVSTSHWRANVHAQERVKLQRAAQDQQENVNHLFAVSSRLEKLVRQPCGLEPPLGELKWQLDETETVNRMRMRTLPDTSEQNDAIQPKRKSSERQSNGRLAINTKVSRVVSENIMSPMASSPTAVETDGTQEASDGRSRADSATNSQLLEGGFELVDDPNEDEEGGVEDKNRKIMTSLQRGDMVQQLYNTSRIVGLEACEGLLVVGKKCLYLQDNYFQRSDGEIISASQAPEDERDPYVQLISGKDVGSQRAKLSIGDQETRHWVWTEVLSISKRRFLFRDVAVEVFFTDGRSYLLTCMSPKVRDDLYSAIVSRAPHVHGISSVASEDAWRLDTLRNPEEVPQSFGTRFAGVFNSAPTHAATKKWVKGEMSNFQYLMLVNTMAGRTFNDLTQYPVFPWVLADYTSEDLDLSNPQTFRDFSKPMGCQTPAREASFQDRFQQFSEMGDESAPPFHYGTHYSSAMIVSSYLIRLQPFVQSYLLLQGGSFDHADRLFDSIGKAWLSSSQENMSDVRELTPEFFYLPEMLVNINRYNFGVKQGNGGAVNDVQLPPWAKGDPHLFIAKHREALESPYVSEQLHQWIDLVFGFKQRGDAAVEATNVFQHLSYHGAKDLDTITDPIERLATIGIIHSFGQTPLQTFNRAHPGRELTRSAVSRLDTSAESLTRLPEPLFQSDEKVAGLSFSLSLGRLLCDAPCRLNLLPNCDRFLQWGFADHSLRFFSSNTKRPLGLYENTHIGDVTTAAFGDSKTLVTAGEDCTVAVWTVSTARDQIDIQPKTYLFGHRTPVIYLATSRVFSTLLSASADGQVLLWGLNRFNCIRVLHPAGGAPIQAARVSNVTGHIVLCQGPNILLYTLNGHLLVKQKVCDSVDDEMTCCAFYDGTANEWLERELIFTGHARGVANVWALTTLSDGAWHLQLVKKLNHIDASREDGGNSSAAVTAVLPMAQAVYTGDENGKVWEWDCIQRQGSISVRGK